MKTKAAEPSLCFISHEGGGVRAPYSLELGITGIYLRSLIEDVLGQGAGALEAKHAEEPDEDEDGDGEAEGSRRFENTEEGASKFWAITVDGSSHTVRYGRIGTDGQQKTKELGDEDEAQEDADRLIAEKTGKGCEEV